MSRASTSGGGRSGCCRCEAAEPGLWEHDTRAVFVPLLLSHSDSNLARSLAACVCTRHGSRGGGGLEGFKVVGLLSIAH